MSTIPMNVTGSLIQAYLICPRQCWLMIHQMTGDQNNDFLSIGRYIAEDSYSRAKKEINIKGIGKVDAVETKNEFIKLIEVKKSSKKLKSAEMQLIFYIYKLSKRIDKKIIGEVRIPKERKNVEIILNEENERMISDIINNIEELENKVIPLPEHKSYCRTCSYNEFCWS